MLEMERPGCWIVERCCVSLRDGGEMRQNRTELIEAEWDDRSYVVFSFATTRIPIIPIPTSHRPNDVETSSTRCTKQPQQGNPKASDGPLKKKKIPKNSAESKKN